MGHENVDGNHVARRSAQQCIVVFHKSAQFIYQMNDY
jgi:hypothetical protein